jgi:hypothetical protein
MDQLLTLQQVAEYLKVSPKTSRWLVARHLRACVSAVDAASHQEDQSWFLEGRIRVVVCWGSCCPGTLVDCGGRERTVRP